jgi:predicted ArsR family transcriptional regulator
MRGKVQKMEQQHPEEIKEEDLNPLQENLVGILKKNGPLTRSQMVDMLSKPRTTIYDNLSGLINREMVKKFSRQINTRGRPVVFFKLQEE